jgi:hypothetical protein
MTDPDSDHQSDSDSCECECDAPFNGEVSCPACNCYCEHLMLWPVRRYNDYGVCWYCCQYFYTAQILCEISAFGFPVSDMPRKIAASGVEVARAYPRSEPQPEYVDDYSRYPTKFSDRETFKPRWPYVSK